MNRRVVDLGFILNQIPAYTFSMKAFTDRLKLQKTIYLIQSFGIYLGYDFSWYLRGPYCSVLANNGFELEQIFSDVPQDEIKFKKPNTQKQFKKFIEFMKNKDVDSLEIAASLHYLDQILKMDNKLAKQKVFDKRDRFEMSRIDEIWEELKKWKLV